MTVVSGREGRETVHFLAPPPPQGLDGLVRAGLAHLWLVTLHPFEDGNGRIARAVTDLAIAQDENQPMRLFSLSSQIEKQRKGYYQILEQTQRGSMDVTDWLVWFLTQVAAACDGAQETVARTLAQGPLLAALSY